MRVFEIRALRIFETEEGSNWKLQSLGRSVEEHNMRRICKMVIEMGS
jgi:hypothetical protein